MIKNQYERSLEHTKEMYRFIFFRSPAATVKIIWWSVIFAYSLVRIPLRFLTFEFVLVQDMILSSLIMIALIAYAVYDIYRYRKTVKFVMARDLEVSGGSPLTFEMQATEDNIKFFASDDSSSTLIFENIKRVYVTKNLMLVHTKSELFYPARRDSFTVGTELDFCTYLREKGIKIKGKI